MDKIVYRVKDLEGNHQDFNSIEEIANEFNFNVGTVRNRLLNRDVRMDGLKVYTVKQNKKSKKSNKEEINNEN